MNEPKNLILKCVAGSHLYGLSTPSSDMDVRGIYLEDIDDVLNINGRQNGECADDKQDEKYYSLGKFLKLASECNPNIIELLWLPEDAILYKSPIYDELIKHREWFMSKRAMHTFKGYAYAQIQRAKGLNKKGNSVSKYVNEDGIRRLRMWLNQPVSDMAMIPDADLNRMRIKNYFGGDFLKYIEKGTEEWDERALKTHPLVPADLSYDLLRNPTLTCMAPPRPYQFIYWYRNDDNGFPFRQVPFDRSVADYDASRVEGCNSLYRLYHHGTGFISDDGLEVKLSSITKEREHADFAGIVRIDMEEYKKAKREYDSFWEWMANRNEARYTNDWDSEGKVDWKNMMHTMRLLICAKSIAETGVPKVRFDGDDRDYLMSIRRGEHSYGEILEKANELMDGMDGMFEKSSLPKSSDFNAINDWYIGLMKSMIVENELHSKRNKGDGK